MPKVGIYAGSFDPVHAGHIGLATAALKELSLDKVFFMVEPRPRRKQGVKALEHRQAMLDLAIANHSNFGTINLSQARFSVHETMPLLKTRFEGAKLYMLLGDDVLSGLADWPHLEDLRSDITFVIAPRLLTPEQIKAYFKVLHGTSGLAFSYKILKSVVSNVSSSNLRRTLRTGRQPDGMDDKVFAYIRKHDLYAPLK